MPAAARPHPKSENPAPATPPQTGKLTLQQWLATRVNGASLGMFRIFFGIVMLLEAISITRPMASAHGSIPLVTYFTSPDITYHLPYAPFQWLPLFGPGIIKLIVAVLGIASVALAAGLFHRLAATLVFLTWGYLYVVESTRTYWMSYYYLELLVSFLIIWVPADRRYSLKSLFTSAKSGPKSTSPATDSTVPYWSILILQLQLVITYFYAGVAKLNADWLLDAQPVKRFLADASIGAPQALQPLLGSLSFAYFLSWTGAIFDLAVGFLLLARRTRLLGFVALLMFHSTNHFLLFKDIVWFPLLGALSATIFLNPDWPERFTQWLRKPRLPKPDLKWLVPGALLLPGLGATLGWKARLTAHFASAAALSRLGIALFAAWLAIQIIVPLRHYFIPGDARVTFEGLAFSWRLKAEFYGVEAAKLTVHDTNFLSTASDKSSTIHWDRWPGDKTFYRFLKRGQINWTNLPEIVVTFEPGIGERIFFNPVSGGRTQGTDEQSMARIQEIWRERFGREAKGISRTFALNEILEGYGRALQSRGFPVPSASTPDGLRDLMNGLLNDRSMAGLVRRTHPFATARASTADHNFMIIEDASLLKAVAITQSQVDRSAWKTGPEQSAPGDSIAHNGPSALPLHLLDDSPESIALLQQVAILTHAADPNTPRIHWNYYKDGTASKAMHVSTNPFLLRRYARRVAALWEKQYGRYPKVTALTGLALNTRPMQQTVDPNADLASVPIARFGHNPWINDLKLERILKSKPAQHDQSIKLGITAR